MSRPLAVDLFSGAGGASLGLVNAGFDLRLAVDISDACGLTHKASLPGEFLVADIKGTDSEKILRTADLEPGQLDSSLPGRRAKASQFSARVSSGTSETTYTAKYSGSPKTYNRAA